MKKKLLLTVLICALIIILVSLYFLYKNHSYNQVKRDILNQIQQQIDENRAGVNYITDTYELDGNQYVGRIFVVNNSKDLVSIKNILGKCKPLHKTIYYKPTDIHIFIGGVNIGYAGTSGHYYWPDMNSNLYGFILPTKYNDELWDFLNTLEYREYSAN